MSTSCAVEAHVQVWGTALINDKQVTRRAELPYFYTEDGAGYNEIPRKEVVITFVEPPQFALSIDQPFRGFRMDLSKGGTVEVAVSVSRAEGYHGNLVLEPIQFPLGLGLEASTEEDGVINVALVGSASELERRPHRIAIRATADHAGKQISEVTQGFTLQVR